MNQKGFGVVESLLTVLVIAVIGYGGYYVWSMNQDNKAAEQLTTEDQATSNNSGAGDDNVQVVSGEDSSAPDGWLAYDNPEYGVRFYQPSSWNPVTSKEGTKVEGPDFRESYWSISTVSPNSERNDARYLAIEIYDQPVDIVIARVTAVESNTYETLTIDEFGKSDVVKIITSYGHNDITAITYVVKHTKGTYKITGESINSDNPVQDEVNELFEYLELY